MKCQDLKAILVAHFKLHAYGAGKLLMNRIDRVEGDLYNVGVLSHAVNAKGVADLKVSFN